MVLRSFVENSAAESCVESLIHRYSSEACGVSLVGVSEKYREFAEKDKLVERDHGPSKYLLVETRSVAIAEIISRGWINKVIVRGL